MTRKGGLLPGSLRRSLAVQVIATSTLVLACAAYISAVSSAGNQRRVLLQEIDRQGYMLVMAAALFSVDPFLTGDIPALQGYLETLVDADRVQWAEMRRADGTVLAQFGTAGGDSRVYTAPVRHEWDEVPRVFGGFDPQHLGTVSVALSTAHADTVAAKAIGMLMWNWGATAVALVLLLALIVRQLVHRPLFELGERATRLGRGDLATPIAADVENEIGWLASILEEMRLKLVQSYSELSDRNARLVELDRLKSELLANTSHEMRTPLNAIVGFTELLLDEELEDERREAITSIHNSARMLSHQVDDFLDLGRLQSGRMRLEKAPFDFRDLLSRTVAMVFEANVRARDVRLVVAIDPAVPERLDADADRLRQVVSNLVGNAVKFTERGEVAVHARLIADDGVRVTLRVEVEDTGIGVCADAAACELLFEPFRQADGSISRRFGGAGLGLAICRQTLELMGGRIAAERRTPEGGSRFWFELPLPVVERRAAAPREGLPADVVLALSGELLSATLRAHLANAGLLVHVARDPAALGTAEPAAAAVVDLPDGSAARTELLATARQRFGVVVALEGTGVRSATGSGTVEGCQALGWPLDADQVLAALCGAGSAVPAAGTASVLEPPTGSAEPTASEPAERRRTGAPAAAQPAAGQPAAAPAAAPAPGQPGEAGAPDGRRVLVVDDNATNCRLVEAILRRFGIRARVVDNGPAAVEALAAGERFDLVLMDCQMPDVDGYETTRRIRALPGTAARTAIVAVTANCLPGARERCLAAGMDDYLPKPIRPATLAPVLDRWLGVEAATS